jgi:hypothetical protein
LTIALTLPVMDDDSFLLRLLSHSYPPPTKTTTTATATTQNTPSHPGHPTPCTQASSLGRSGQSGGEEVSDGEPGGAIATRAKAALDNLGPWVILVAAFWKMFRFQYNAEALSCKEYVSACKCVEYVRMTCTRKRQRTI